MKLIRILGIGEERVLYTQEAYEAARLVMSTGDFHVHTIEVLEVAEPNWDEVIDLNLFKEQCAEAEEERRYCACEAAADARFEDLAYGPQDEE